MAFDEEKDERWITIHPNGAEKGKHVKVNGEGEVVAGNKHLVKALNEKNGAAAKRGGGAALLEEKAPPFASLAAKGGVDPFGGEFEEFSPPDVDSLNELLDGDDDDKEEQDGKAVVGEEAGAVVLDGHKVQVGVTDTVQQFLDYVKHKTEGMTVPWWWGDGLIYGALRGVKDSLKKVESVLGEDDPLVRAIHERIDYVDALKKNCRNLSEDAKEISQAEAEAVVAACFNSLKAGVELPHLNPATAGRHISHEERQKKIRYLACAMKAFTARFPKAQLLDAAKKTTFIVDDIVSPGFFSKVCGDCFVSKPYIRIDSISYFLDEKFTFAQQHPLAVSPLHGENVPPLAGAGYWPKGSTFEAVLVHELAHRHVIDNDSSLKKFKEAIGGCVAYGDAFIKKVAPYVSKYATASDDECHSEIVATIASPLYIQGSLPEAIEKYVYEEVLGCAPGTWKKRETLWDK